MDRAWCCAPKALTSGVYTTTIPPSPSRTSARSPPTSGPPPRFTVPWRRSAPRWVSACVARTWLGARSRSSFASRTSRHARCGARSTRVPTTNSSSDRSRSSCCARRGRRESGCDFWVWGCRDSKAGCSSSTCCPRRRRWRTRPKGGRVRGSFAVSTPFANGSATMR